MKLTYPEFNKISLNYLVSSIQDNRVDNKIISDLLDFWENQLKRFRLNKNLRYFEYYVLFESMHKGILNAFIYDLKEEKYLFEFKPIKEVARLVFDEVELMDSVSDEKISEIFLNQHTHFFWTKKISFRDNHYLLGVVFLDDQKEDNTFIRIETVFKNYYLPEIFLPDERFFSYPSKLDEYTKNTLNPLINAGEKVSIFSIYFYNYKLFIHSSGDFYTEEALMELDSALREAAGDQSDIFALGLNCWMIFQYNSSKELLEKIMNRHVFEIRNYMFKFKYHSIDVTEPSNGFFPLWKKLLDGLQPPL